MGEKERQELLIHCMRIMKFDNYLSNIYSRNILRRKLELSAMILSFGRGKKNIFSLD